MPTQPLSPRGHARATLRLGLPLIGSHVAQFAVVMTDTLLLGWYDVGALAAQVLAGTLFFILFIVGSGFAWAVMPLISECAGQGDATQVRRVTRMGLWLSMLAGVAVMPAFVFAPAVLRLFGQEPELAALAGEYLAIQGWSIFPALVVMVLKSYLSALERTRVVLWVTLVAVAVNAGVNWLLIFGHWGFPEMGIRGAAWASLVVNLLSAALLIAYAVRVLPEHALFRRLWRPDVPALRQVFALGWPIGLTSLAETGLFSASSIMMGWLGEVPLAAHGIALQITALVFMVHVGLANAATIRTGQAFGRGDLEGMLTGAWVVLAMSAAVVAVTMGLFLTAAGPMVGLFLDPDDPARDAVIALGIGLLAAAALFQAMDAGQVMALGLLRGVQDTRGPMWIAAVSYWPIGVTSSYVLAFPLGLGGVGIWLGLALGLAVAAVLLLWRFWTRAPGLLTGRAPAAVLD